MFLRGRIIKSWTLGLIPSRTRARPCVSGLWRSTARLGGWKPDDRDWFTIAARGDPARRCRLDGLGDGHRLSPPCALAQYLRLLPRGGGPVGIHPARLSGPAPVVVPHSALSPGSHFREPLVLAENGLSLGPAPPARLRCAVRHHLRHPGRGESFHRDLVSG